MSENITVQLRDQSLFIARGWEDLGLDKVTLSEILVIGPKHKVNPPIKGIQVASEYIEVSNNATNL